MGRDRCWVPVDGGATVECDHQPNAGRGITFGDGWFVANFGWGSDGSIRRSRDGVHWEEVQTGKAYGNTVFLDSRFVAASTYPQLSDDGVHWRMAGTVPNVWDQVGNVRRAAAGHLHDAGVILMAGDKGLVVSLDGGAGWFVPATPSDCRSDQNTGGIVIDDDRIVIASARDSVCVTTDLKQWTIHDLPAAPTSQLAKVNDGYELYAQGKRFRSVDGKIWSNETTHLENNATGPLLGTIATIGTRRVAVKGGWENWYERQRFYWSDDGLNWHTVTSYAGSHPIRFMTVGMATCE